MQCIWQSVVERRQQSLWLQVMKQLEGSSELQFVQQLLWAVLINCTVDTISFGQALRLCLLQYLRQQVHCCCNDHNSQRLSTCHLFRSVPGNDVNIHGDIYIRITSHTNNMEEMSRLVTMKLNYNPFMYHLYD